MSCQNRREFVRALGGVAGMGVLAAVGDAGTGGTALPASVAAAQEGTTLRGPYADADWVGHRGGPGNTAAIDTGPVFDGDPDCRPLYEPESQFHGEAAILDDAMYIANGNRLREIDLDDGSVLWRSDELGVGGTPSAAYGGLYAGGSGGLVAVDLDSREVSWRAETENRIASPAVGYERVYAVLDGSLVALDPETGAVDWRRDTDPNGNAFEPDTPAVGAGQVHVIDADGRVVAYDAATGDRRWVTQGEYEFEWGLAANDSYVVALTGRASEEYYVFDASTGEGGRAGTAWHPPALDDEAIVNVSHTEVRVDFFDDREGWRSESTSTWALGPPAVDDDTVYVHHGEGASFERFSLLAFDKYTGELLWTCEVDDTSEGQSVAVTSDSVYTFGYSQIHVAPGEAESSDGSDGSGGDDPTPTEGEGSDGSNDDGSGDGGSGAGSTPTGGDPTPTAADDPTSAGGTATESPAGTAGSSPNDRPATGGTPTGHAVIEETTADTDGDAPGFGVAGALAGLGGLGYLLRRRLGGGSAAPSGLDSAAGGDTDAAVDDESETDSR